MTAMHEKQQQQLYDHVERGDGLSESSKLLSISRHNKLDLDTKCATTSLLAQHLYTLYLFTRSDFKTVIVPQSIFALAVASRCLSSRASSSTPPVSPPPITTTLLSTGTWILRITTMLVWLWLHLIVENVANQRLEPSVLEDAVNKPWRPIPAGLITPAQSQAVLRWAVPLCLAFSSFAGGGGGGGGGSAGLLLLPSATLMCFVWLYNDLDGSAAGPVQRSAINAAGLACFGWGALAALTGAPALGSAEVGTTAVLPRTVQLWIAMIAVIVFTTVHAADFPDIEGDRERSRQTMPLVYGEDVSRWFLAVAAPAWSVASLVFWHVEFGFCWVAPMAVSGCMAGLTVSRRDHGSDEMVWKLWCLWVVVLFLLPVVGSL